MSWFDDEKNDGLASGGGYYSDDLYKDVQDSVQMAFQSPRPDGPNSTDFSIAGGDSNAMGGTPQGADSAGDYKLPQWAGEIFKDYAGASASGPDMAGYGQRQGVNSQAEVGGKEEGGLLGRVSSFVDKNKSLSEMIAKGLAGALGGNTATKTANIQAKSQLDQIRLKDQLDQEQRARMSASITGLTQPGRGILSQGQLKRSDGTNVFTNGRIV